MVERLPISEHEILIRYGRMAPNARDRVLDQFYLLIPDCTSLKKYTMTQAATFFLAFISMGLVVYALFLTLNGFFHWSVLNKGYFVSGFILIFEVTVVLYVMRRRLKYRKRYHEKFLQPTELGLTPERINVHHRIIHGGTVLNSIRWDELSYVELVDADGSTDEKGEPLGSILKLRDHADRAIDLKLDYIQTIEERQILRDLIYHYAQQIDVRSALTSLLRVGKRDDIPFTRLWCQALQDARPRVHTAPLARDATLQDGRFTIVDCIGGGGQGTVYAAEMRDLDGSRNIVLKEYVLPDFDHSSEHKAACEQFEKEIRLLGQVSHDGVIKLIDAFVEDHRAYLVLHHVNGMSLKNHVEKHGPIDQAALIPLALQMCDILNHLHSMQPSIMHLDFSPENLLLSADNKIILIDFNISVEENAMRTRTVMGKQRYMAPEQYRGTPTTRSDIYSLGASMFYLLTGREPEPISVARAGKHVGALNEKLDQIIVKCTALEESDRFQTAQDVQVALEEAVR